LRLDALVSGSVFPEEQSKFVADITKTFGVSDKEVASGIQAA
jgi:hypothetical protein